MEVFRKENTWKSFLIYKILLKLNTWFNYRFTASDGKMKLKAILQSSMSSEVISGAIQNLGLVRILDYTLNDIPMKNEKWVSVELLLWANGLDLYLIA